MNYRVFSERILCSIEIGKDCAKYRYYSLYRPAYLKSIICKYPSDNTESLTMQNLKSPNQNRQKNVKMCCPWIVVLVLLDRNTAVII